MRSVTDEVSLASAPRKVGILGGGVMGVGVAQTLAAHDFDVQVVDVSAERLDRARDEIRNATRLAALVRRSASSRPEEVLSRICYSTVCADVAGADLVIENVTEDWAIKASLYAELDSTCREECVFAVNTSTISIARIAAVCRRRPGRVIGLHFMNPVPMNDTVELVVGDATAADTVTTVEQFLDAIGKRWITVRDGEGFVSNRVLMLAINEAIAVLDDGIADAATIDRLFRECCGHRMGPLETADLIGLDTVFRSLVALQESRGNKYAPCERLRSMVSAGLYGRKSGSGFYAYEF